MTSILDQYMDDNKIEKVENDEVIEKKPKKKPAVKKADTEIEEKREQLSILAVLGTIKTYTGVNMNLGDVKKLSPKDVDKYYNRYQILMGNKVTNGLVDTAIETAAELVSYVITIDNKKELCKDLQKNELVKQELNNLAGFVILKGGRTVALASGLLQIAKHIKISNNDNFEKNIHKTIEQSLEQTVETVEQTLEHS